MAIMPVVSDFPTFKYVLNELEKGSRRCIWYLPDKKRSCSLAVTPEESRSTLELVKELRKSKMFTLDKLAKVAEDCCCGRHHRNKIYGSGLANVLASRWQHEVPDNLSSISYEETKISKVEESSPQRCDTSETPIQPDYTGQAWNKGQLHCPVAFSKHVPFEEATISTLLRSKMNSRGSKEGSIYIYTIPHEAFAEMIKIGYTSKLIDQRLDEWAECGHGVPRLSDSYEKIRFPERVEQLTHSQLVEQRYDLRWCNFHGQAHIEWFKTAADSASHVIQSWSSWIQRANPYDRRGVLKVFWKDIIEILDFYEISITAELMLQIQEVKEGSRDFTDLLSDDTLRKEYATQRKIKILKIEDLRDTEVAKGEQLENDGPVSHLDVEIQSISGHAGSQILAKIMNDPYHSLKATRQSRTEGKDEYGRKL